MSFHVFHFFTLQTMFIIFTLFDICVIIVDISSSLRLLEKRISNDILKSEYGFNKTYLNSPLFILIREFVTYLIFAFSSVLGIIIALAVFSVPSLVSIITSN